MYTRPRKLRNAEYRDDPLKFSDRPMRHSVVHNITLASHLLEYSVVFQIYNDKTYLSFHGNDEFVVLAWEASHPWYVRVFVDGIQTILLSGSSNVSFCKCE